MSIIRRTLPAMALALSLATAVPALAGTTVSTEPLSSEGKQIGCVMSFVVTQPDKANFGGSNAEISGSLNFMMTESKTPIYALKLGVAQEGKSNFAAPAAAYLLDGDSPTTSALVRRIESDTKGYALFVFNVDDPVMSATISSPAQKRQLRFSYQMKDGGKSTTGIVSFDGDEGLKTVASWLDCLKTMVS